MRRFALYRRDERGRTRGVCVAKSRDNQREPVYYMYVYVHQKRVDDDDDVVVDRRRRRLPLWDGEKGIRPLPCVFVGGFSPPEGITISDGRRA